MSRGPDIDGLVADARSAIGAAATTEEIRHVGATVTGKKSPLAEASRALGALDPDARKELGRQLHEARAEVEALLEDRRAEIRFAERSAEMAASRLDLTEFVPGSAAGPDGPGPPPPGLPDPGRPRGRVRRHGVRRGRGSRDRDRLVQLRRAQHPAGPSGPGDVGHLLPGPGRSRRRRSCAPTPRRSRST